MRLIDADRLENVDFSECMDSMEIMAVIDVQPTVYDVDKVIKELRESAIVRGMVGKTVNLSDAIEIVQKGVVANNDVCEWQGVAKEFIKNPHTKRLYSNEPSMKNFYCNTCGRKIKVV